VSKSQLGWFNLLYLPTLKLHFDECSVDLTLYNAILTSTSLDVQLCKLPLQQHCS